MITSLPNFSKTIRRKMAGHARRKCELVTPGHFRYSAVPTFFLSAPVNPRHPMKKFLHSRDGASKGAALIIVLALVMLTTVFSQTPAPCVYAVPISMVINNPGHNYAVGDRLRAVGGIECIENYPLSLQVNSVNASGGVTAATIIGVDSNGYLTSVTKPSNPIPFGGSATGSDFQASFTFAP
jgi:hypothetical protein